MPEPASWSAFLAATIVLLAIPGPSVLYVMTRALEAGYRGAVYSAIGLALGDLLQVVGAAVGVSALAASSPVALTIVKYAGGGYLMTLGVRRLRRNRSSFPDSVNETREQVMASSRRLVVEGLFALNPKTGLFFVALSSQFVSESAGPAWLQILLFGVTFVALGLITNAAFGCVGSRLGTLVMRGHRFPNAMGYLGGVVLMALGVAAALGPMPGAE